MVSGEGLDAYGAVTWGQFFIYQGFNDRVGWMHTSSGVDAVDEYLETVHSKDGHYFYKYGDGERPVVEKQITVPYRTRARHGGEEVHRVLHPSRPGDSGSGWQVGHHPADAGAGESADAVLPADQGQDLQGLSADDGSCEANSSNNTIYADADGHIAYFHGNFIPRRDTQVRLHQAGGWERPGDGMARAC